MSTMSLEYDGSGRFRPKSNGCARYGRNAVVVLSLVAIVLVVLVLGIYGASERLWHYLFKTPP